MKIIVTTWFTLVRVFLMLAMAFKQDPKPTFLPPPPATPREIPGISSEAAGSLCLAKVDQSLADSPPSGLTYREERDEVGSYGLWRFEGISGRLDQRQIDQRGGPVFDLLQVFSSPGQYLWAAVGVTIPPHYFVHDSDSLIQYQKQGHADQPYYLSYIPGLDSAEQIQDVLKTPGAYRLSLSLNGAQALSSGVDWRKCLPSDTDACLVGAFVDRLMDSGNGTFIETGHGSPHPFYGFITFQIALLERVDLCSPH
jgi:hypothetical protein